MARLVIEGNEVSSSTHDALQPCEVTSMSSSCDAVQVELNVRKRILRQNRELARSNSNFSTRIAELERLVSSLRQENLELQLENIEMRRSMKHVQVDQIESLRNNVSQKFCDILNLFDQLNGPFHDSNCPSENERFCTVNKDEVDLAHSYDREVASENVTPPADSRTEEVQLYNNPDYNLCTLYEEREEESASVGVIYDGLALKYNNSQSEPRIKEEDESSPTTDPKLQLSNDYTHRSKKRRKSSNRFPYIQSSTQTEDDNTESLRSSYEETAQQQQCFDDIIKPDYVKTSATIQRGEQTCSNQLKPRSFSRLRQKASPMANEQMPQNSVLDSQDIDRDGDGALDDSVERRSTGRNRKKVNYALPSLRTKMRRSNDQLADAVSPHNGPMPLSQEDIGHQHTMQVDDAGLIEKQHALPKDSANMERRLKRSYSECLESDSGLRMDRDGEFEGKENMMIHASGKATKMSPLKKAKSSRRKTTNSVLTERQANRTVRLNMQTD